MSIEEQNPFTPTDGWYGHHEDPDQRLTVKNDAPDYGGYVVDPSAIEPVIQPQDQEAACHEQLDLFTHSRIKSIIKATRDGLPSTNRNFDHESRQAATRAMDEREGAGMLGARTSGLPNYSPKV